MINGIINVSKDKGFTSHDVVAKLRGILKQKRIGHTGTLDPDATGVLPVCLGNATKLVDMLTDMDKEYIATLLLGVSTDTEDITGTVLEERPVAISEDEASKTIMSFVGTYMQIPPMYSAIKVNGQKMYELARAGKTIEREPRKVDILEIEIMKLELPRVVFRVRCSKGTYIRSLCRDIGEKLGCLGCMEALVRSRVGRFTIDNAYTLSQIQDMVAKEEIDKAVTPTDAFFADYPTFDAVDYRERLVRNGNSFETDYIGDRIRVYVAGSFAGIYDYDGENKLYRPFKMFLSGE